ncbi:MAG: hypothetical protein ACAI35_15260 [Candidatus Methylacidiphilales bacterium]|nr:hypothetical protein [Candidatus Methylacidiphilales bacterium]
MGYKKQRLKDGKPGVNFNGFVIESEMIAATGLKKNQIHSILRTTEGNFFSFVTGTPAWRYYLFFAVALCLFTLRFNRLAAEMLTVTILILSAYRMRENYKHYRAIQSRFRNLINILDKIRIYSNISDKLHAAHELKKHGVDLHIHTDGDDLEEKLVQLRANIIKSLNADRILRQYSTKWGDIETTHYQAAELTDLDTICAKQVDELQIALNTEARLLREATAPASPFATEQLHPIPPASPGPARANAQTES